MSSDDRADYLQKIHSTGLRSSRFREYYEAVICLHDKAGPVLFRSQETSSVNTYTHPYSAIEVFIGAPLSEARSLPSIQGGAARPLRPLSIGGADAQSAACSAIALLFRSIMAGAARPLRPLSIGGADAQSAACSAIALLFRSIMAGPPP